MITLTYQDPTQGQRDEAVLLATGCLVGADDIGQGGHVDLHPQDGEVDRVASQVVQARRNCEETDRVTELSVLTGSLSIHGRLRRGRCTGRPWPPMRCLRTTVRNLPRAGSR